jgi:hypothetical protein
VIRFIDEEGYTAYCDNCDRTWTVIAQNRLPQQCATCQGWSSQVGTTVKTRAATLTLKGWVFAGAATLCRGCGRRTLRPMEGPRFCPYGCAAI